jgi:hypothetical protein
MVPELVPYSGRSEYPDAETVDMSRDQQTQSSSLVKCRGHQFEWRSQRKRQKLLEFGAIRGGPAIVARLSSVWGNAAKSIKMIDSGSRPKIDPASSAKTHTDISPQTV